METTSTTAVKTIWAIDPQHTEIQFKIRHMVISTVTGSFNKFEGKVVTQGDNFENAKVEFTADVNSINTNQPDRDKHLKSADFFDAENFPKLTFVSKSIRKKTDEKYEMTGDITIRGVTKEIVLDINFGGIGTDHYGLTRAGFEITGKLNRKEFGLKWDVITETGSVVAADEVKIAVNTEVIKQ